MALFEIIAATVFIGFISLVGVVFLWINEKAFNKILFWLVSFASGTLLGAAFLDLLPEASEGIGFPLVLEIVLASIVVMFLLEKVLSWHHHHGPHSSEKPIGSLNLIGGAFHNFFDGVAIAASFLTSTELGITTTIAVALHEIPQELSDFSLLVYSGFSKKKALLYNFLSEILGVIGALSFVYFSSIIEHLEAFGLAFTGGMFVYIATADLLPELNKQEGVKKSLLQLAIILFGIALIKIITTYFAE